MNKIEVNVQTGEQKIIELTAEEIEQAQIQNQEWLETKTQIEAEKQTVEATKKSALDKLMALGLTEEEALSLTMNKGIKL
jgi:hypothetical protein